MGFNISGLAINKNYKDNFEELQKELGLNLKKSKDISFETAFSNWKEEGIYDVYFSEKGTLIFMDMDSCTGTCYHIPNANTLTFVICETSMAFDLNYSENGVEKRSIMVADDEILMEEGEKLEIEKTVDDMTEIILAQVGILLGVQFGDIDFSEKAERYIPLENEAIEETINEKEDFVTQNNEIEKESICSKPEGTAKKWWQFWK